jgi:hypothetical protein
MIPASCNSNPHFVGECDPPPPPPIPAAPTSLTATCYSNGDGVTISYPASANATQYSVQLYDNVAGVYLVNNPAYTGLSYTSSVVPGRSYWAGTYAINSSGWSPLVETTFTCPIPAVGAFEAVDVNTCSVSGWAYDPDSEATSIDVHVYRDGPYGTGTYTGAACTANIPRPGLGLAGNHGFLCTLPATYAGSGSHPLFIHAIDAVGGGPNNVIGGSPKSLACPTAALTTTSCEIPSGSASCNSNIVWSALDFNGTSEMQQNSTTFSTAVSSGGTARAVTPDNNTFTLRDTGSTFSLTRTATVTCAANSVWVGGLSVCAPLPEVTFISASNVVRSGTVADIQFSVNSTYNLVCTINDGTTTNTVTHTGTPALNTYTETTRALTAAQIINIDCTSAAYPVITGNAWTRVNVIPAIQEI